MAVRDLLFGRKGGPPEVDLAALQAHLTEQVRHHAGRATDPDLVCARLADACRDAGLAPVLPEEFDALAAGLDEEAWRRLAVLVGALDLEPVRGVLGCLAARRALPELVAAAFPGLARQTALLTLDLLGQSALRVEELARHFIASLGAGVRGESGQASKQRLERLDYGRLLAEAERAKRAAEGRMEQLRKLQDEQERRLPRRGKQ
jgi:hypothetical protein